MFTNSLKRVKTCCNCCGLKNATLSLTTETSWGSCTSAKPRHGSPDKKQTKAPQKAYFCQFLGLASGLEATEAGGCDDYLWAWVSWTGKKAFSKANRTVGFIGRAYTGISLAKQCGGFISLARSQLLGMLVLSVIIDARVKRAEIQEPKYCFV